jgi:hypothetical protein
MSHPEPFKIYRIDSNLLSHPSYAICVAYRNGGGYLKAESFVLLQTSAADVCAFAMKISLPAQDPTFPFAIDEAFAHSEALRQAEVDTSLKLHDLNVARAHPIAWPRSELVAVESTALAGVWMQGKLSPYISRVGDVTNCDALQEHINALRRLPTVAWSSVAI